MDLRSDLVSQLETTNTLISSNRETDLDEKKQISATITDLESKTDKFRGNYDDFVLNATGLGEIECSDTF